VREIEVLTIGQLTQLVKQANRFVHLYRCQPETRKPKNELQKPANFIELPRKSSKDGRKIDNEFSEENPKGTAVCSINER
jgi:hypothetical protein